MTDGINIAQPTAACQWCIHGQRVEVHHNVGGWWASSPDVAGFGMVANSLDELRELVCDSISVYLAERPATIRSSP